MPSRAMTPSGTITSTRTTDHAVYAKNTVHWRPLLGVTRVLSGWVVGSLSAQMIAARKRLPKMPNTTPQTMIEMPIHR